MVRPPPPGTRMSGQAHDERKKSSDAPEEAVVQATAADESNAAVAEEVRTKADQGRHGGRTRKLPGVPGQLAGR